MRCTVRLPLALRCPLGRDSSGYASAGGRGLQSFCLLMFMLNPPWSRLTSSSPTRALAFMDRSWKSVSATVRQRCRSSLAVPSLRMSAFIRHRARSWCLRTGTVSNSSGSAAQGWRCSSMTPRSLRRRSFCGTALHQSHNFAPVSGTTKIGHIGTEIWIPEPTERLQQRSAAQAPRWPSTRTPWNGRCVRFLWGNETGCSLRASRGAGNTPLAASSTRRHCVQCSRPVLAAHSSRRAVERCTTSSTASTMVA